MFGGSLDGGLSSLSSFDGKESLTSERVGGIFSRDGLREEKLLCVVSGSLFIDVKLCLDVVLCCTARQIKNGVCHRFRVLVHSRTPTVSESWYCKCPLTPSVDPRPHDLRGRLGSDTDAESSTSPKPKGTPRHRRPSHSLFGSSAVAELSLDDT